MQQSRWEALMGGGGSGLAGARECTVGTGPWTGSACRRLFRPRISSHPDERVHVCVLWEPAGAACRRVTPGEETDRAYQWRSSGTYRCTAAHGHQPGATMFRWHAHQKLPVICRQGLDLPPCGGRGALRPQPHCARREPCRRLRPSLKNQIHQHA